MTIYEWLVSKINSSTSISAITTDVLPEYSDNITPPFLLYYDTGFNRNLLERNTILAVRSVHNSKADMESLNTLLYDLFDTSTAYIRESSSNLNVDSVSIINNSASGYDETNKTYWKDLELSIWYNIRR